MQFSVTEKEIRNGIRESYTHNPVSLAIKRQFRKERNRDPKVEIFQLDYVFIDGLLFDLPNQPQTLLKKFHVGQPVQPIVFELEVPDGVV